MDHPSCNTDINEKIVSLAGVASCLLDETINREQEKNGSCDPRLLASLSLVRDIGALGDEWLRMQGARRARDGFRDWLLGWDAEYFPAQGSPEP